MEFAVLGPPEEGPTLDLDHREFAYAGKFVMSSTGKAVARDGEGGLLAAVAFSGDRTDDGTVWLRYITVRADRRGEGIGPRLAAFVTDRLHERYPRVRIAVNNPFAYHALYKAGFGDTGETTGVAERVLAHPAPRHADYESGLVWYRERDLSDAEREFVESRRRSGPPPVVSVEAG